ncbi:hypothetical protein AM499_13250 [Bacillus sp. FJAT-22090]|uniref:DUF1129 family protein n=1 Tax=Bacillus sp. FJAT-22090 TaxID=1581038 RepID=UPI0006ADFAE2|nr:DUF1129 family protein [Bacillus sp. FJAT-22090]ALC86687.1 hypothetical protein AM499_13250 [Bacillus sp. FJAT-22090]
MKASELIEQNNQKRELLTEDNEKYYSGMLLYIRTKLSLSEQQSEEVLMEMLDHLIEGQEDGKTAREIFGDDPRGYADEIINHLPKEERKSTSKFLSRIGVNLLGWFLVIRSVATLLVGQESVSRVYIVPSLLIFLLIALLIAIGVKVIFGLIHKTAFDQNSSDKKMMLQAGLYGAGSFLFIFIASYFIKDFGPSFVLPWTVSLGIGAILLLTSWLMKKAGN